MSACCQQPVWADLLKSDKIFHNLSVPELVEQALARGEGKLTSTGALLVSTGKYTGRSPNDRFVIDEPVSHDDIDWGPVNKPFPADKFDALLNRVIDYLKDKDLFVFDGYAGADKDYQLPVRIINEYAWHHLFVNQLFVRPEPGLKMEDHKPGFTVIRAPGFKADPERDGTRSEAFILVSFEKRVVLIGAAEYAGETKKSIFSVMNYLMPKKGVLSMHCSANVGKDGDVALFFGLSGTGKTTLSADPNRGLVGDDEHVWTDNGVFNIEGGCYAKTIKLSPVNEPQIYNALEFGAVLENVVVDENRVPDYDSDAITENTRAGYAVDAIPGAIIPGVVGHPNAIFFLTADAFGVLPPIAKLTKEQAMYHFLAGFTSKLAGTEIGIKEPQPNFSACFGAPFLPLHPQEYAKLLGEKMDKHGANVYLVNTGWTGGPYGVGHRMSLPYTRGTITAALTGALDNVSFTADPVFGFLVPDECPGVPTEILNPRNTWKDPEAYDKARIDLAQRFNKNFAKFGEVAEEIKAAGPKA